MEGNKELIDLGLFIGLMVLFVGTSGIIIYTFTKVAMALFCKPKKENSEVVETDVFQTPEFDFEHDNQNKPNY